MCRFCVYYLSTGFTNYIVNLFLIISTNFKMNYSRSLFLIQHTTFTLHSKLFPICTTLHNTPKTFLSTSYATHVNLVMSNVSITAYSYRCPRQCVFHILIILQLQIHQHDIRGPIRQFVQK